jgi:hypothetical protein
MFLRVVLKQERSTTEGAVRLTRSATAVRRKRPEADDHGLSRRALLGAAGGVAALA